MISSRLLLFAFLIAYSSANANTKTVRIASSGPSSSASYEAMKSEIEKLAGVKLSLTTGLQGSNVVNMNFGLVDLVILAPSPEILFADPEMHEVPRLDLKDYQWQQISESKINFLVHPENPVSELTRAQATELLNGETKSWSRLINFDQPVRLLISTTLRATTEQVCRFYVQNKYCPAAEALADQDSVLRNLMKNKGAIAIAGGKPSIEGFTPKIIPTEATLPVYFFAKKKASPEVKKVLEAAKKISIRKIASP